MKKIIFILSVLFLFCAKAFSQVTITIPTTGDTAFCSPTMVTMHATTEAFGPHRITFYPDDSDDGTSVMVIPIGFPFNFYGTVYNSCVVSSNGFIQFDTTLVDSYSDWDITTDGGIPGDAVCENSAMGLFSDILLAAGGGVWVGNAGVAPNRKFVVEFCNTHMFSCTDQSCTFQMILYEGTNVFESHIRHKEICTSWDGGAGIEGVENATATVATAAIGRNYPDPPWFVSVPDARRFIPNATFTSYTVDTIPYNPLPDSGSIISWLADSVLIGTGDSITVLPTSTTSYIAFATSCDDTDYAYATIIINPQPAIDTVTYTNPTACGTCDGTITLHGVPPGYPDTLTYYIDGVIVPYVATTAGVDSTITITGLCGGTYTNFTIRIGQCSVTWPGPIVLTSPHMSFGGFTSTNPSICGACDATITLNGLVPGSTDTVVFLLNGVLQPPVVVYPGTSGSATMTGLCDGTYSDFIISMGYCKDTAPGPINIVDPAFYISGFTSTNPSVCGACDGTITLEGLVAGMSDTVNFDLNGVVQPPVVQVATSAGSITLTGLCAGAYSNITVKMNDCITPPVGPDTLVNPPFIITGDVSSNTTCGECNGTITLTGMTPLQTIIINFDLGGVAQPSVSATTDAYGTTVIHNLCPGTYSNITATLNTCVAGPVGPLTIVSPPVIPITLVTTTNPTGCGLCDGTITVSGLPVTLVDTVFYKLNDSVHTVLYAAGLDSNVTIYGLCAGTYDTLWMKVGNCPTDTIGSVTLTAPVITPGFTNAIHYGCIADTVLFTDTASSVPTGYLYYEWDFGDSTSDTSSNPVHVYNALGTYTVIQTVTNNVCTYFDTTVITLSNSMSAAFSAAPDTLCQLSPTTFTNTSASGLGGLSYQWYFGDGGSSTVANPVYTYSNSGTYIAMLISTNFVPCNDTAIETVQVDTSSNITVNVTDTSICQGTYITYAGYFASLGNIGIVWNFDDGDTVHNTNPLIYAFNGAGVFTITASALYRACANVSTSSVIRVYPQPSIYIGADTAICPGSDPLTLADQINAGNPYASWMWSNGSTGSSIAVVSPGVYWATVSINNCWASDSVTVRSGCYIDIPNVFSPNSDGINDYFFPRQLLTQGLVSFNMNIYNRWGQLIFTSTSIDGRGWDGTFNSIQQPEDVYVYIIDATFIDGQKEHHQGNVTLIR